MKAQSFVFSERTMDRENRIAVFEYVLKTDERNIHFSETVQFPTGNDMQEIPEPLLNHLLDNLHLVLGISYWKSYASQNVELPHIRLTKDQAQFWTTVYTYGMGEFFFKNKLDFHNYVSFPYDENYIHDYFEMQLQDRSLVGIGGGKDSVVAVELLRDNRKPCTAFIVENVGQQHTNDAIVNALDIDSLKITRKVDPQVKTLSGAFQGHIPISAIYAFLGLTTAVLYNYKYVVVANEHSSNYGNVEYLGVTVNHQWSKSSEFEKMLQDYIKQSISPQLHYFSLLRPFTELKIVEMFIKYPKYFPLFTSCNRNYRISPQNKMQTRWCGECAKCAFAFVMLAAYLSEEDMQAIFGKNIFADQSMVEMYKELLGTKEFKPFDCVGTPEEVSYAFFKIHETGKFKDTPVMKMFESEELPKLSDISLMKHRLLTKNEDHLIPDEMVSIVQNI